MNKRKKVWITLTGIIAFFCVTLVCSTFFKIHVNFSYSECSKAKKIGFSQNSLIGEVDFYYEDDLTIKNISKDISNLSFSVAYNPFVQLGNIQTMGSYSILFFYDGGTCKEYNDTYYRYYGNYDSLNYKRTIINIDDEVAWKTIFNKYKKV